MGCGRRGGSEVSRMSARSLFALVDCNNFFVSCERVFNLRLQRRPMVVLSNNDGCAVARSNEVKALGVKMGTPWFQMKDLARRYGIVALSSNFVLYGDMSDRVVAVLRDFSPDVEVYSIDESFVRLDGLRRLWASPAEMGLAMRQRILQWTGLPVCVGIATSKTLAKLANHIAKTRPEFDGVCDFHAMSATKQETLLAQIDVGEVWGIGRKSAERLRQMGIENVQALREAPQDQLRARFGVVMARVVRELQGDSCLALDEVAQPQKQIIASRSFGVRVTRLDGLNEAVSAHVTRAAERLRKQASLCGAVHVYLATNRFCEQDRQYANSITMPLAEATDDTRQLAGAALSGLERIFREGYQYQKAGVALLALSPVAMRQQGLFSDDAANRQSASVMAMMDAVNARFGRSTLALASAGLGAPRQGRSENRTPRYTTSWQELPSVLAR